MRLILVGLVFCTIIFSACGPEDVVLEEAAVNARIDSLVGLRTEDAARRAAEDLEKRKAIEVKVKADSILAARAQGAQALAPNPAAGSEP